MARKNKRNKYKIVNGTEVVLCKYYGKNAGHGTYIAASINGELIVDSKGKPVPYKQIVADK